MGRPRKIKDKIDENEEKNKKINESKKESFNKYGDEDKENFITEYNRSMSVNFSKVLERDLGEYNEITYVFKRRAFYNYVEFISYNLNYILNKYRLLGIVYLDFHTKIFSEENDYTFQDMFKDIKENLLRNEDLRNVIS